MLGQGRRPVPPRQRASICSQASSSSGSSHPPSCSCCGPVLLPEHQLTHCGCVKGAADVCAGERDGCWGLQLAE